MTQYGLGLKNLRHRQLRSWLTMIGIFIGIATVVSLIALGAGLKAAIASQFSTLGTDRLVISAKGGGFGPPGQGTAASLSTKDLKVVETSAYVKSATGRLLKSAQVQFNDKTKPQFVGSIPEDASGRAIVMDFINVPVQDGHWMGVNAGYQAVIGADYAKTITYGKPVRVGSTLLINGKKVTVVGILSTKGGPQVDGAIFMNEKPMRDLFNESETVSGIIATVTATKDLDLAKQAIEKNLRSSRGVKERKEDFTVETSAELLASFDSIINGVSGVLIGIAAISLLVGGIGIMNTMYTAVIERTREIGIMKAVGARNSDVMQIFLFESGLLGLTGAAIGVAIGWALSLAVELAARFALGPGLIQAQVSISLVFGALAFGFVVGSLAGALPAYEAAKLPPVEALRG